LRSIWRSCRSCCSAFKAVAARDGARFDPPQKTSRSRRRRKQTRKMWKEVDCSFGIPQANVNCHQRALQFAGWPFRRFPSCVALWQRKRPASDCRPRRSRFNARQSPSVYPSSCFASGRTKSCSFSHLLFRSSAFRCASSTIVLARLSAFNVCC
jgi:hypothetical protein